MKDFKTYYEETILEYAKGDPMMYSNSVSAKKHSKSLMRGDRKHMNLLRKDYVSKNPMVASICKTKGEKMLKGQALTNFLDDYSMTFKEGLSGISKSGCKIYMYLDAKGDQVGVLHHKDHSTKYENRDNS